MVARVALIFALGCSSKSRPPDDAARVKADGSAAVADGSGSSGSAGSATGSGEASIRVEWKTVPVAARTSPGPTPCHTPRAPAVAPTTMFAIPDALVSVEGITATPAEARISIADCTLSPRLAAGAKLIVESALDRPAKLVLTKHGDIGHLDALAPGTPRAIQLPIAGHAVAIALDPGGVYRLTIDGAGDFEPAWIVAAPAAVTDVGGQVTIKSGAGSHAVTAWLPARSGQPAKLSKGSVTIEANNLVEQPIDLAP